MKQPTIIQKIKPYLPLVMLLFTICGIAINDHYQVVINKKDIKSLEDRVDNSAKNRCSIYMCSSIERRVERIERRSDSVHDYLQNRLGWKGDHHDK